ncbi:MAG TPA: nitroreductase family protein [Patescibacteria group bacterium]|nr:nitroreductase family protein [Patescibacteria group bacterium]
MSGSDIPSHHGPAGTTDGSYPNEIMKVLFERASLRDFSDRDVTKEVLEMVLKAGTHAPTGGNLQPYSIIKVQNGETRRALAELMGQRFIGNAPVSLLFCIDLRRLERWAELEVAPFTATSSFRHFWISFQDTVICAQNICTAADSMGLGSVYVGSVLEIFRELREMFLLPSGVFPVVLLCLGYPKSEVALRRKLGIDVVVHEERYSDPGDDELLAAFNDKYSGGDARQVLLTEERLRALHEVSRTVHGAEFADRCVARARENGFISAVQRYFGLHYRANRMPKGNLEFIKMMEEADLHFFREYTPKKG